MTMTGRYDAIVVVLDVDPWDAILNDPRPRPELVKAGEEAHARLSSGQDHAARSGHDAVKSVATNSFWKLYRRLPDDVRQEAREAFRLFRDNPAHPGLSFERLRGRSEFVVRADHTVAIGPSDGKHERYDRLVLDRQSRRLRQEVPRIMSPSPDPPFDPQPQGISLDELAEAFAQVMGVEPRRPAETRPRRPRQPSVGRCGRRGGAAHRPSRSPKPLGPSRRPRTILARSVRGPSWRRCCLWAIATTSRFRRAGRPN